MQLLTVVVPHLERLSKEGEQGRKKITQYTRYGTVVLSIIQGFGISVGLESMMAPGGAPVVLVPGWGFRLLTMITLTSGTAFIMWLGEQITERGIGNGISLIIFSGIVVRIPNAISNTFRIVSTGELSIFPVLLLIVLMVGVVGFIVFIEQGQRRIPVQYAKRVIGRKLYGGQSTHLPLKDKYFRGDSAHICLFHYHVSGDTGQFHQGGLGAERGSSHQARKHFL